MKYLRILSLVMVVVTCLTSQLVISQAVTPRSISRRFESSHVNDTYTIDVYLPSSYFESEKEYPVLIVLDGDKSSGLACDIVDWLSWAKEIPELCGVS